MRAVEDLYDAKTLSLDDYVELKGNLLNGEYVAYRDALADILTRIPNSHTQLATIEALHIKAQQLARYKEQQDEEEERQRGGDAVEDDEDGDEDDEDDDEEDEGEEEDNNKAREDLEKLQAVMKRSSQTGGRFAAAPYGPDYTPRYKPRLWT